MNLRCLLVTFLVTLSAFGQEAQPTFDYHQAIKLDLSKFEVPGPSRPTKGRRVGVGSVIINVEELNDELLRGHWVKYYFREITDHPENYQPGLQRVLSGLLTKLGMEVVSTEDAPVIVDLYFHLYLGRKGVQPEGHRSENGSMWLFPSAKKVSFDATMAIKAKTALASHLLIDNARIGAVDIYISQPIEPAIGGGFTSLYKAYPGTELMKFPQFISAVNASLENLVRKGTTKLVERMDEERVDDMWRGLANRK